ncbi:MAG: glycosyltransferase [Methyloprofundus sp.]|nr:glycosyltransferase [Methyloprofundus sp.]
MLEAFKALGYEVDVVAGYSPERKKLIKQIKQNIKNGVKYDFVYSESSTMPTVLTDKHHLPLNPFLDFGFFGFCKKQGIPIGLFYRDIYWLFDEYYKNLNFFKSRFAKLFYYYDLFFYKKTLTKLYLPSMKMGEYIPIVNRAVHSPLPPGHTQLQPNQLSKTPRSENTKLKLFYVGGLSNHYQMHILFEVLTRFPDIEFTLCTREQEWLSQKSEYPAQSPNIKVVHKSGEEMTNLLIESDIVSLFVKPQKYREFAAPVKLYEYLGHAKPIIASTGTLAGEFVKDNGIGWTIDYDAESLAKLLRQLITSPVMINKIAGNMRHVSEAHTWQARATQVANELKGS